MAATYPSTFHQKTSKPGLSIELGKPSSEFTFLQIAVATMRLATTPGAERYDFYLIIEEIISKNKKYFSLPIEFTSDEIDLHLTFDYLKWKFEFKTSETWVLKIKEESVYSNFEDSPVFKFAIIECIDEKLQELVLKSFEYDEALADINKGLNSLLSGINKSSLAFLSKISQRVFDHYEKYQILCKPAI